MIRYVATVVRRNIESITKKTNLAFGETDMLTSNYKKVAVVHITVKVQILWTTHIFKLSLFNKETYKLPVAASRGAFAPLGGSVPSLPSPRRKKWPKSAIFGKFLDFCPLRIAFCPLDVPHKKFLVPPLQIT